MAEPNWKALYADFNTVAVVGYSRHRRKPAHYVPTFLRGLGYRIIPVNPNLDDMVDGLKAYPHLLAIPPEKRVDVVSVFRRSAETPRIARAAASMILKPQYFWMQRGIANQRARHIAEAVGMTVIENTCMMETYQLHVLEAR